MYARLVYRLHIKKNDSMPQLCNVMCTSYIFMDNNLSGYRKIEWFSAHATFQMSYNIMLYIKGMWSVKLVIFHLGTSIDDSRRQNQVFARKLSRDFCITESSQQL